MWRAAATIVAILFVALTVSHVGDPHWILLSTMYLLSIWTCVRLAMGLPAFRWLALVLAVLPASFAATFVALGPMLSDELAWSPGSSTLNFGSLALDLWVVAAWNATVAIFGPTEDLEREPLLTYQEPAPRKVMQARAQSLELRPHDNR